MNLLYLWPISPKNSHFADYRFKEETHSLPPFALPTLPLSNQMHHCEASPLWPLIVYPPNDIATIYAMTILPVRFNWLPIARKHFIGKKVRSYIARPLAREANT